MTTTPSPANIPAAVAEAIRSRRSIRRFLPAPVPRETLEALLELAARAPSGTNVQPWKVYALAGSAREALSSAILEDYASGRKAEREFDYYPREWSEPWLSRRRKVGLGLYQLLGIAKGDKERMTEQTGRNYRFFDAPVGLILTMNRQLGRGMFLDYGIFIGNFITAARSLGLDTCVQAAFADYPETIRKTLGIGAEEIIVCGIALGHADPDAPENQLVTEREPVAAFTEFRGF
ncbi:MAG: nitroreductase [Zoogloeaceae bacterium]|jgi:nitroreductase|nr:nitroreductase [Zoogloeaceae bacterium]